MLHIARMKEKPVDEEHAELTEKDFNDMLITLQERNREKYQLILKAGQSLIRALFRMFKRIWSK